jgi:hypothetical protein
MFDAKRFRPKRPSPSGARVWSRQVRLGLKKRQALATRGSRNRQRPCPLGAFYGQAIPPEGASWNQEEAVFIGVRARSDPSP